jgi:hypothetical protein
MMMLSVRDIQRDSMRRNLAIIILLMLDVRLVSKIMLVQMFYDSIISVLQK